MDIPRDYRFKQNPTEEQIIEEFLNDFSGVTNRKSLHQFRDVALTEEMEQERYNLNEREEKIILNTIQWLGSPVGQHFMKKCGFEVTKTDEFEDLYPDHSSNQ